MTTTPVLLSAPLPTPDQQRLLRAALLPKDAAIAAWNEWRATNAPQRTDFASRRLLPLAYRNLCDSGAREAEVGELRHAYEKSRAESAARLDAACAVSAALLRAGIDVLVLKGAALVRFYGGDAALRPMRDLDVLVPADTALRAASVLSSLGYRPFELGIDCLSRFVCQRCPGWPFVAADRPEVDLHWHVLHDSCQPRADDDLWAGAVALDLAGVRVKALNATDQLLHVCAHALQPTRRGNLRWVADAMRILREETERIDWPRLLDQVVGRRLVPQVRRCFDYLTASFAAPIPTPVSRALASAHVSWLERAEFHAQIDPQRRLGTIMQAVLAYQARVRWGREPVGGFRRFVPRHLWGASHWWQMPAWWLLDRLDAEPPAQSALASRLFAAGDEADRVPVFAYALGRRLAFCRDGDGLGALGEGWSYAEPGGVWSDAALARVSLELAVVVDGDLLLEVEIGAAMLGESKPTLEVHVLANSSRVARWRFAAPLDRLTIRTATLPATLLRATRRCQIDFRILRPRSPASLGINEDERLLGLHLRSLRLTALESAGNSGG